jgi:predicted acetyltransferase
MNYEIVSATIEEKDKLYRLLQYALYDGSQYIDNDIDEECRFEYGWFDNYFTDDDRDAYFIKNGKSYLGMAMVNENLKFNEEGKCISEFLILPKYRRYHIGKRVAYDIFNMFKGDWEVQPMENNPTAYAFWNNIINEYTNGNYTVKNDGIEDVFMFKTKE